MLKTLETLNATPGDLRDGARYKDPKARGPAPLKSKTVGPEGATFIVDMAVDPDAVRQDRAEADVVVAEVSREKLTIDTALRSRSAEDVSGTITITITFDVDPPDAYGDERA